MSRWQLAQLNVGTTTYDLDDPRMAGFMGKLDEINALADGSPGFVWRLQSDSGNATDIDVGGDPRFIVNMSVWENVEALFAFTYKSDHREVMSKRRQWFRRPTEAFQVLWWVPAGHIPTAEEALARLAELESTGPSDRAFTFKETWPAPDSPGEPRDLEPEPYCVSWPGEASASA